MGMVLRAKLKGNRRRSKWTVKVYHTLDGNANIISYLFRSIGRKYYMVS